MYFLLDKILIEYIESTTGVLSSSHHCKINSAKLIIPGSQIPAELGDLPKIIQGFVDSLFVLVRGRPPALHKEDVLPSPFQAGSRVDTGEVQTVGLEDQQCVCQCTRKGMINRKRDQRLAGGGSGRSILPERIWLLQFQLRRALSAHVP